MQLQFQTYSNLKYQTKTAAAADGLKMENGVEHSPKTESTGDQILAILSHQHSQLLVNPVNGGDAMYSANGGYSLLIFLGLI